MKKDPTRKALEAIKDLRSQGPSDDTIATLGTTLQKADGFVVASAAILTAEWYALELSEDLVNTFHRLCKDGTDCDPQCWGKVALIKALTELAWQDAGVYLQGCRTIQMEPVRGGQEDSAAGVRMAAFHALVQLPRVPTNDLMTTLVDLLADDNASVRTEAARASIHCPFELVMPLLRLKIRLGDEDVRVLGSCFDALLVLEPNEATVNLLLNYACPKPYLEDDVLQAEALAALASSDVPMAVEKAIQQYAHLIDEQIKRILLTSLGSSSIPKAQTFLLKMLGSNEQEATWALDALKPKLHNEDIREQVIEHVRQREDPSLLQMIKKE